MGFFFLLKINIEDTGSIDHLDKQHCECIYGTTMQSSFAYQVCKKSCTSVNYKLIEYLSKEKLHEKLQFKLYLMEWKLWIHRGGQN